MEQKVTYSRVYTAPTDNQFLTGGWNYLNSRLNKEEAKRPRANSEERAQKWLSLKNFVKAAQTEKICAYMPERGEHLNLVCGSSLIVEDPEEPLLRRCSLCQRKGGYFVSQKILWKDLIRE
jgi:hypothetical protein